VKQYGAVSSAAIRNSSKVIIMKIRWIVLVLAVASISGVGLAQPEGGRGQGNMNPDEQKMAMAIQSAPDPAAKLKAAGDFIKKYPKSSLRPRVAHGLAEQISAVTDPAQKVTLAQSYRDIFKEPSEQEMIEGVLIDALVKAKRMDEAFSNGAEFIGRNPDSLRVLVQLISAGTNEAKNKNGKFVTQSLQYGNHAIQMIEANQKPADIDDATWGSYKTDMLPSLYQSVGLLNLVKGDRAAARAGYAKAAELAPTEPFNVVMLAGILNDEYQNEAKRWQAMPNGPAKDEELKKAQSLMDATIDAYAHAVAVSEGNASLQQVRQQYMEDLESYYKYRHNNSTAGMQALIDKYKVTAKP
jgi:hypothetical protein